MKKIVITATLCLIAGLATGWFLSHYEGKPAVKKAERKILYYRNPMDPTMTSQTPKKAPDGMDYVPVYEEESTVAGAGERKIAYYKDPMHPWYTSDKPGKAPDCGMDLVPVYEDDKDIKGIKINPNTVQNIGVKIEKVTHRELSKTIRTSAIVEYDETKIYNINTKFMGWIEGLFVDYTGKMVSRGEPLLDIYSPDLVSTQEEYLQAVRYRNKLRDSTIEEVRKEADLLVQSAARRLAYWNIPEQEINALEKRGTPKRAMTIFSPAGGIVTEKMVTDGQQVMAGMTLYKIADLSTVWITADIYQFELEWVRMGQTAELSLSYLPDRAFTGTITYIYPYLNAETRTAKVRIEVKNTKDFLLKPGMFVTVKIISPVAVDTVAVPEQAIIRSGTRNIAVIDGGGGYFEPREVKLGVSADGFVQITEGLHEMEKIVTSAQFLIDSESNLKAAIGQMTSQSKSDGAEENKVNKDEMKKDEIDISDMEMDDMDENASTQPAVKTRHNHK
jgi:RND family efflux transporter MFP subunit